MIRRMLTRLAALLLVPAALVGFNAMPANAANACPLYPNIIYHNSYVSHSDSYGTWWNTDHTTNGYQTYTGNTTCNPNVYVENLLGPFRQNVDMRVWYIHNGVAQSHNPVPVLMATSVNQEDGHLYNLGPVSPSDAYRIEILQVSNVVGIGSAQCSATQPCWATWRG